MSNSRWTFIGVDAGGTSTCAVHASQDGAILKVCSDGPANPYVGIEHSVRILASLITDVRSHNADLNSKVSIIIALSGGDSDAVRRDYEIRLTAMLSFPNVLEVVHDSFSPAALLLPVFDMHELPQERVRVGALIAGTGSVALIASTAITQEDHLSLRVLRRSGGWGPVVSDKGSAYCVTTSAIGLSLEVLDGIASESAVHARQLLREAQIHFLGIATTDFSGVSDLLQQLETLERARIAAFAKRVCALAQDGNSVAYCAFKKAGNELARLLKGVLGYSKESTECVSFVATGGLFAAWDIRNSGMREGLREGMMDAGMSWKLVRASLRSSYAIGVPSTTGQATKETDLNESAIGSARLAALAVRNLDCFIGLMNFVDLKVLLDSTEMETKLQSS